MKPRYIRFLYIVMKPYTICFPTIHLNFFNTQTTGIQAFIRRLVMKLEVQVSDLNIPTAN